MMAEACRLIFTRRKSTRRELIFSRLHAGLSFQTKIMFFLGSSWCGVSVVNALSTYLDAEIKRDGKKYEIKFKDSVKKKDLRL